eukprot:TRINITY_DN3660_c0_g1_i4.p1 TRINITY_DN3660_c0_g1~~TRINITY_DN3660_c0_g1_i4.p1  ORF type:complete len:243 (+),score=56.74 TRINITY_DN3660_c0_g1_i4:302-1030(+)
MSKDGGADSRVFVGGISWKADEESLSNFFSSYGRVEECKIIMDKATGKSKGYGFVTFSSPESAQRVKQNPESLVFLGKQMNVGDAVRKNDNTNYSNDGFDSKQGQIFNQGYQGYPAYPYYPNQMMFQPQHHAAMMYMAANGIPPFQYFGYPFDPNFAPQGWIPHQNFHPDGQNHDEGHNQGNQEEQEDVSLQNRLNSANFPPISAVYGKGNQQNNNGSSKPAPYIPMMQSQPNGNYKQALNP